MTFKQLIQDLKKGDFATSYVLHGDESFYIDQIVRFFEDKVLNETEKAFNFSVLYGKEVDFKAVLDHARQFPVMASRRVVIIKEAQSMRSLNQLSGYIEKPSDSTILVIVHKHKKLDGRTAFTKAASKHGVVFEAKSMREKDLPGWIMTYVKEHGMQIETVAAEMITQLVDPNLSKVSNELDKIMIGMEKGSTISRTQVIEEIGLNKDYNIFELQSALASGDLTKTHRIVRHFTENMKANPLVMLIGVLYSFFSKLYIATAHPGASDQQLAQLLGYRSAWFVRDHKAAMKRYRYQDVEQILLLLHEFDLRSKGMNSRSASDGELLKELIDRILYVRLTAHA